MGKTPNKKLVFVMDEHGRVLTKESLHNLISELLDKVFRDCSVEPIVASGATINICKYLADQISMKDIADWEVIYLHGSKYPPVLLDYEDKEELTALLPRFKGTSAEAIYKVLEDSGTFDRFH